MKQQEEIQRLKLEDRFDMTENIKNLYESIQKIMKLYNDYAKSKPETVYRAENGTGFKIIALKQMLQR